MAVGWRCFPIGRCHLAGFCSTVDAGRWALRCVFAMNPENFLGKLFARGNSYWLTRFVILRLIGFVYAVAFLIAAQQLLPLIGEHGLTPANRFLASIHTQLGSDMASMLRLPTLFCFGIAYHALLIFAWVGFGLSLIVLAGYAHAIFLPI